MSLRQPMTRGDFIEVTPTSTNTDPSANFGTLRGTTLTTLERIGYSGFTMEVDFGGGIKRELELNCNFVDVNVLFRADMARSHE